MELLFRAMPITKYQNLTRDDSSTASKTNGMPMSHTAHLRVCSHGIVGRKLTFQMRAMMTSAAFTANGTAAICQHFN
jgi:hypothetical protein